MKKILLINLLILNPLPAQAGAWLKGAGVGEFQSTYNFYYADRYFDADGDRYKGAAFLKAEYAPYAEYGLFDWLTIGGTLSLQSIYSESTTEDDVYDVMLNNGRIFVRTYLYEGERFVVSLEPEVYLPADSTLEINPEGDKPMPGAKLNFGYSFPGGHYIDTSIGFRHRYDGDLSDMVKYEIGYGHKLYSDLTILTQLFHTDTRGRMEATDFGNYDSTHVRMTGIWDRHRRISYQFGVGVDVNGENTSSGISGIYSVWYKF